MKTTTAVLASTVLFSLNLSGCAKDPGTGAEKAEVSAPAAAKKEAPTANAKRFAITTAGSKLGFVGAKLTAQHEGSFPDVSGVVELADGKVDGGSVKVEVGLASLQIEPAKLAGHLKSPDFFDVEKFPKATFTSTSVAPGGEAGTYVVKGNLDLHGVTKGISFPAKIEVVGKELKANAEFSMNRKDFGIVYPGMPDDLIKDTVLIKLTLNAQSE